MKYEIYYSDGGHCGPYQNAREAYAHANAYLNGFNLNGPQYCTVEVRPTDSKAIGGFKRGNPLSFYVSNPDEK